MCSPSEGDNIILVGFMGAGKTTVARELAAAGYVLVDLDERIVRRCGRSIPEIFAQEGESFFRDCETEALQALEGTGRSVIATGGGVVGREENWVRMRRLGKVVYLRASWPALQRRLLAGTGRPLAAGDDWARVEALWRQRLPLYERADLAVDTEDRTPAEVAAAILEHLHAGDKP